MAAKDFGVAGLGVRDVIGDALVSVDEESNTPKPEVDCPSNTMTSQASGYWTTRPRASARKLWTA